tara:strand:+ start:795 stop:1004 length:210 start_codon:yes stop_codon:yes gene_type:complete
MNNKEYREYYTRRKQEKGTLDGFNIDNWEEIPDEDLWEDGELNSVDVAKKLYWAVIQQGEWKLIRKIEE